MPEKVTTKSGRTMRVTVHAAHRNGICIECGIQMEVKDVKLSSVTVEQLPQLPKFLCPLCKKIHMANSKIGTRHWQSWRDRLVQRPVCPKCGGTTGQVIAKPTSIQAPDPPSCISFKCLWRFVLHSLFLAYLSSYHRERVAYAEANRPEKGKQILGEYRTGENAPGTLWKAIIAIIKLKYRLRR